MNIRGVGSTALALTLVLGVAACDDNPTSEGRESGAYIMVNPVDATVDAGDTTRVIATVMNKYGTPTNQAVTAEPCDSKVTAAADPARTQFESPETFLVIGRTIGESCVVLRGGGLVDTARVRVVAAHLVLTGDSLLLSGSQGTYTYTILDAAGNPVSGLDLSTVTFSSGDATKGVVTQEGVFTAYAAGVGSVIVRTNMLGVARADTVLVRVAPAPFDGTISPGIEGEIMTITAGSIPFDATTKVLYQGVAWPWKVSTTPTTLLIAAPPGVDSLVIYDLGPNRLAQIKAVNITSREPADDATATTTRVLAQNDTMWFTLGDADTLDYARLEVPAGGSVYAVNALWADSLPPRNVDVGVYNSAGTLQTTPAFRTCATANSTAPTLARESCLLQLSGGTWYLGVRLVSGDSTTARLIIGAQTSFTGTVVQSAGLGGQILTFTAGTETFDANTRVRLLGRNDSTVYLNTTGNTVTAALPYGIAAGTVIGYQIINVGAADATVSGVFVTTASSGATETWVGNDDPFTAPMISVGQAIVGRLEGDGTEDYYRVTVTEAGTYRLQVDWTGGTATDIDVYITDEDYETVLLARETAANPEVGTVVLQPGVYVIDLYMWHANEATTTYRVRFTKQ